MSDDNEAIDKLLRMLQDHMKQRVERDMQRLRDKTTALGKEAEKLAEYIDGMQEDLCPFVKWCEGVAEGKRKRNAEWDGMMNMLQHARHWVTENPERAARVVAAAALVCLQQHRIGTLLNKNQEDNDENEE